MKKSPVNIVILGAGPSGLGAGYEFSKHQQPVTIFDTHKIIGGLARTIKFKGNLFDVGPHRFYTKDKTVLKLWEETLGTDFLHVPRLTRIYYRNRFFDYPIKAGNVLKNLGLFETGLMLLSYFWAMIAPKKKAISFEDWISQKFGKKLYRTFFKTYTEKVWGVPCHEIDARWAAQRIKGLNLTEVITNALMPKRAKVRSLISEFRYPTKGAGMMYETMANNLVESGSKIYLEHRCQRINHTGQKINSIELLHKGQIVKVQIDKLLSSIPITDFIKILNPLPEKAVIDAAKTLRYRDHITVNLIIKDRQPFPDNWIYVHSPEVKMARISNYNQFSHSMTTGPDLIAISCEYFCYRDDEIWKMKDEDLVKFATQELEQLKLAQSTEVSEGFVIRELDSYPLYYLGYEDSFNVMKDYLLKFENLTLIGRAGMFKYNNMDHALLSGIYAARNEYGSNYDLWNINEDSDYLEEEKSK
ncbi:MAG: amine oxidase [Candidatus Berkelbacteria bacterium Gr01-1014_85]|uniref:Amine oxidase n=1 Tax=Candidatus Berkelbacteria bacterium Gr01-1014_85 TaxID=2017150 RepID=A0A554JCJ8_9BACT|nr:MAG: amine oxidase [Candidatus Berkelbacteria bacterium Gr01-1014_85]